MVFLARIQSPKNFKIHRAGFVSTFWNDKIGVSHFVHTSIMNNLIRDERGRQTSLILLLLYCIQKVYSNFKPSLNSLFYCVYNLNYHLVIVTEYRNKCIDAVMLKRLEEIFKATLEKWKCELIEFNGVYCTPLKTKRLD